MKDWLWAAAVTFGLVALAAWSGPVRAQMEAFTTNNPREHHIALADNVKTNLFTVTIPNGDHCALQHSYHYGVANATDSQMHTGRLSFGATANADDGALVSDFEEETELSIKSIGTLTDSMTTASGGANSITAQATFNSSLNVGGIMDLHEVMSTHCEIVYH